MRKIIATGAIGAALALGAVAAGPATTEAQDPGQVGLNCAVKREGDTVAHGICNGFGSFRVVANCMWPQPDDDATGWIEVAGEPETGRVECFRGIHSVSIQYG